LLKNTDINKNIKGYQFNKQNNVFNKYVLENADMKDRSVGTARHVIKSLQNNLIGRFGINPIKPVSKVVNQKNF